VGDRYFHVFFLMGRVINSRRRCWPSIPTVTISQVDPENVIPLAADFLCDRYRDRVKVVKAIAEDIRVIRECRGSGQSC